MASTLSRLRDTLDDDLQGQIAALSKEVSALRKTMSSRGSAAWDDGWNTTADLYEDLRSGLSDALPVIRKQAHHLERTARDNPVTTAALVGLVVVGLAVALMSRR
jgi:hypothetical protein